MSEKPASKSLSPERSASVRALLATVIERDFDGNVKAASRKLGVAQSQLALFTAGRTGAGLKLIEALANYERVSFDQVLGRGGGASPSQSEGGSEQRGGPGEPDVAVSRTSGSDQINTYLQAIVRAHLASDTESDAAFARRCGVTPGAINAIKNRAAGGGMRMLESIARGLNRPPWELYREAMAGASAAPGAVPLRALPSPTEPLEPRAEKKQLVAAYVRQRLLAECSERGVASRIAEKTGFSTAHVANAKNHGTIGADFAEAMARVWGLTGDQLHAAARSWAAKAGFTPSSPPPGLPLRDLPSWPEAAKAAGQIANPKDIDEVGGFVPPASASVVTALAIVDLARGWAAIRAASAEAEAK